MTARGAGAVLIALALACGGDSVEFREPAPLACQPVPTTGAPAWHASYGRTDVYTPRGDDGVLIPQVADPEPLFTTAPGGTGSDLLAICKLTAPAFAEGNVESVQITLGNNPPIAFERFNAAEPTWWASAPAQTLAAGDTVAVRAIEQWTECTGRSFWLTLAFAGIPMPTRCETDVISDRAATAAWGTGAVLTGDLQGECRAIPTSALPWTDSNAIASDVATACADAELYPSRPDYGRDGLGVELLQQRAATLAGQGGWADPHVRAAVGEIAGLERAWSDAVARHVATVASALPPLGTPATAVGHVATAVVTGPATCSGGSCKLRIAWTTTGSEDLTVQFDGSLSAGGGWGVAVEGVDAVGPDGTHAVMTFGGIVANGVVSPVEQALPVGATVEVEYLYGMDTAVYAQIRAFRLVTPIALR